MPPRNIVAVHWNLAARFLVLVASPKDICVGYMYCMSSLCQREFIPGSPVSPQSEDMQIRWIGDAEFNVNETNISLTYP